MKVNPRRKEGIARLNSGRWGETGIHRKKGLPGQGIAFTPLKGRGLSQVKENRGDEALTERNKTSPVERSGALNGRGEVTSSLTMAGRLGRKQKRGRETEVRVQKVLSPWLFRPCLLPLRQDKLTTEQMEWSNGIPLYSLLWPGEGPPLSCEKDME